MHTPLQQTADAADAVAVGAMVRLVRFSEIFEEENTPHTSRQTRSALNVLGVQLKRR
jgi:hypothetical protein